VIEAAVFKRTGTVAFEVEKGPGGASHISTDGIGITVPSLRLDAEQGLLRADLLKLDLVPQASAFG
jgi:hypothetical protein